MSDNGSQPLVAVITRTKDRPLFMERAARSVLGQRMRDFVWVIVNDGGEAAPIDALVERHRHEAEGRVHVVHQPDSIGMQPAANAGIADSRSTYVVIHDDDDTWDPRFLERATEHLERTGAMGVALATDLVTERIDGDVITTVDRVRFQPGMRTISIYRMCFENLFAPIAFVFRRSVLDEIGLFDPALRGFGDWDFHLRFLERYDVDYLDSPQALAGYHQRPEAHGEHRNSVFSDDQHVLADRMFNKWLRRDLERGRLGIGYLMNSLRNRPVDGNAAFLAILSRIDERTEDSVARLAKQVDERIGSLSDAVQHSLGQVSLQHQGLVPYSHRVLQKVKQLLPARGRRGRAAR